MGRLLLGAIIALLLVGCAWLFVGGRGERFAGDGSLITAPPGPYRVVPDEVGGMAVEGQGSTAFAASEGAEAQGRIDPGQAAETPIAGRRAGTGGATTAPSGRSVEAALPPSGGPLTAAGERR